MSKQQSLHSHPRSQLKSPDIDDLTYTLTSLRLGSNLAHAASHETALTNEIMPKRQRNSDDESIDGIVPKRQHGSESNTPGPQPSDLIGAFHEFMQEERKTNFSFLSPSR